MNNKGNLGKLSYKQLTPENIKRVYRLFEGNINFFTLPFDYFQRGSLEDAGFEQELSFFLFNSETNQPIAAFITVTRKNANSIHCFLKGCVVDSDYREHGVGSKIVTEILKRAKEKNISEIFYGASVPNYWQPGVDVRHTSLFFFLKKHGFKSHRPIFNLTASLTEVKNKPALEKNGYRYERVQSKDFNNTLRFVKKQFPRGTWAEEVQLSFKIDPPTTFIAKNIKNEIFGFSTHSQFYPGSFGPTGVLESLRGKSIGTQLFFLCLWDMKQNGLNTCEIMWVGGDTIKFYSKVIGAYISPIFYPMYKKIK